MDDTQAEMTEEQKSAPYHKDTAALTDETDKRDAPPPEPIEPSVSADHQTVIDHMKAWTLWLFGQERPGEVVPTRNPRAEPTPQIEPPPDVAV